MAYQEGVIPAPSLPWQIIIGAPGEVSFYLNNRVVYYPLLKMGGFTLSMVMV